MKNKFYLYSTLFLVLLIGIFIFISSLDKVSISSTVSQAEDLEDYQKVVLSMSGFSYSPETISVKANKPVRIYMDNRVQGCYRDLVISAFNVRKYFRSETDYVEFTPTKTGTYGFSCSMNMGRGKIIVE